MNPTTLDALARFPEQLERHFAAVPRSHWHWTPPSWNGTPAESFTAIEHLCHVRDIEVDGYHRRFRRLLDEAEPELESVDGYALAAARNYSGADPAAVLQQFAAARQETLTLLGGLSAAQLSRSGHFEGYGRVTLMSLVHYLCSHDQQHVSGLQWLLGQIESAQPRIDG